MFVSPQMLVFFSAVPNELEAVWDFASLRITIGAEIDDRTALTVVHKATGAVEVWELLDNFGKVSFLMFTQLPSLMESGSITLTPTEVLWMLQESDNIPKGATDSLIDPLIGAITRIDLGDQQLHQDMRIGADTMLRMNAYEARGSIHVSLNLILQAPGTDAQQRKFDFQIKFDQTGNNPTVSSVAPPIWAPANPPDIPFITALQQLELAALLRRRF